MFLEQLSSGFTFQLAATRAATSAGSAAQERISKTVYVRMRDPDTGATVLRERSLRCVYTAMVTFLACHVAPMHCCKALLSDCITGHVTGISRPAAVVLFSDL